MTTPILLPRIFGHSVFCDDIRIEEGGKVSFMGVYNGGMTVHSEFPVALPKFCIWLTYFEKVQDDVKGNVRFCVFMPGADEASPIAQIEIPLGDARPASPPFTDSAIGSEHVRRFDLPMQFAPLVINQPGLLKVRAFVGEEMAKLGALRITQELAAAEEAPESTPA